VTATDDLPFVPSIGLEVHCQLATHTKMFSACSFSFGAAPNTQTDPYTWGLPGTLPVPNARAVELAVRLALATGSTIHAESYFARKHYFYPDLPKGYQITQSDRPYATGGRIVVAAADDDAQDLIVPLIRIHLEEDAGKNIHPAGASFSLVDYNRAGVPLVEIVSEPAIGSAADAGAVLRELRAIVRALGISDANMEEGTLRCDANVSVRRIDETQLGVRCEIKNLNSFRFLEEAIEAEIARQSDLRRAGRPVETCTLSYDPVRRATRVMRSKEQLADYRYLPDPDLPPLRLDPDRIEAIRRELPELPGERRARYRAQGLGRYDAGVLASDVELGVFFDRVVAAGAPAKAACNFVTGPLLGRLHAAALGPDASPVSPGRIAELLGLVEDGTVSTRGAKEVFELMWTDDRPAMELVEHAGLRQVSDAGELERVVQEIVTAHAREVEQWRAGKTKVRGWLVGQVMKRTAGRANPQLVDVLLARVLAGGEEDRGE
jgi:aspartyl-tRNA(Asn)/glutamyl-tRNA(Gln) amidotransferase subunit B